VYDGLDTCAVDGLCATACPVGINTGDLVKHLRAGQAKGARAADWVSAHFALVERSVGWAVRVGHWVTPRGSASSEPWLASAARAAEKLSGVTLPKWNRSVPHVPGDVRSVGDGRGPKEYIYFPSCISRQLGKPPAAPASLAETLVEVARRAGVGLSIPPDVTGVCCGMPFASKGYEAAYRASLKRAIEAFWMWSEGGRYPIVIDTTSCTHSLLTSAADGLDADMRARYAELTLLDSVDFLHDVLLPRLNVHALDEDVILHPNCSARKLGLEGKMLAIARQCARSAVVPLNLGCCAFAGDRGLLFPELTASATEKEAAEVRARGYGGYYSSNIPCEMGMREATGQDYLGIVYLVERASRPTTG
ncbi:MAG: (Fe-S)-binding protein, partial [Anaerolineales bacterium]